MSRHTKDKRIFMVEKYNQFKSSLKVIESWKQNFPNINPPAVGTILNQVRKFHKNSSIKDLARISTKKMQNMKQQKID